MTDNVYTADDYLCAIYAREYSAEEMEKMSDYQRKNTLANIDTKITVLTALLNEIRDYSNPFRYIVFLDEEQKYHNVEITPELYRSEKEIIKRELAAPFKSSKLQNEIYAKYSDLDYRKKYKLTTEISMEMKIHILYAESLNHIRSHYDRLPQKYKDVFRENKFCNIYAIVKSELLEKLNAHIAQKIQLLSIK